jgi:hypothetical protein
VPADRLRPPARRIRLRSLAGGSAVIAGNGTGRYVAVWLERPLRAGLTESIRARLLQAAGASPSP